MKLQLSKIRQRFENHGLSHPEVVLRNQLEKLNERIGPGARIAIAVGSRGLDNLTSIVREVCAYVKRRDAEPFIVPAMGSHGGATAEGQADVLRLYAVTEETVDAPVRATMEVIELTGGDLPIRVFMDRLAYESDGVILINRIKPHTDFHGRYESGLMKMALIGLGKREGALAIHRYGAPGLRELIAPGASRVLAGGKVIGGVALVEDAYHHTMVVRVLKATEISDEEPELLEVARRNMPRLPMRAIDVLLIDRMGKDISGVGMDPNVTGRIGVNGERDPEAPQIGAMLVCDLTDQSRGNAIGVGLADVVTKRLYDKIDRAATYSNVVTSSFLERGKIPLVADSDREAFDIALRSCGALTSGRERIVRILDTLNLEELYVSPTLLDDMRDLPNIEVLAQESVPFDAYGALSPF